MRDQTLYEFRLFLRRPPGFLARWPVSSTGARWDRHYLVGRGLSLRLEQARRVVVTRWRPAEGFAVEEPVLDAALPLDWAATTCVEAVLPRSHRPLEVDGSTAQTFVDSLAAADLKQASVLRRDTHHRHGGAMVTLTELSVPAWNAATVTVSFRAARPDLLRTLLARVGLDAFQHQGIDDWLHKAARAADAGRLPRRTAA